MNGFTISTILRISYLVILLTSWKFYSLWKERLLEWFSEEQGQWSLFQKSLDKVIDSYVVTNLWFKHAPPCKKEFMQTTQFSKCFALSICISTVLKLMLQFSYSEPCDSLCVTGCKKVVDMVWMVSNNKRAI